jgi:biotin transporter BioY
MSSSIGPIVQMVSDQCSGAPDWVRHITFGFFIGFVFATFLWGMVNRGVVPP